MSTPRQPIHIARMRAFEMNYARIMRLFPDLSELGGVMLFSNNSDKGQIRIELLERSPYTSKLELTHQIPALKGWIPDMRISVHVYHDAEVAEVVSYQNQKGFQPRNPYPNPQMHHPYEKAELNKFLSEWLDFCLKQLASGDMLTVS
jgi:uncharacterized protein YqiB (DUF1249 family)